MLSRLPQMNVRQGYENIRDTIQHRLRLCYTYNLVGQNILMKQGKPCLENVQNDRKLHTSQNLRQLRSYSVSVVTKNKKQ